MLTQQRLQEVLDYDPNTGIFTNKIVRSNRCKIGHIAGKITKDKRHTICIDGKQYYAHRLAWLWVYGYLPLLYIDHKNGNSLDNRIDNLREVTHQQNHQNVKRKKNNTTGITGISYVKRAGKWRSYIINNYVQIELGYYEDIWDAICARKSAELVYQPLRVVSNQ